MVSNSNMIIEQFYFISQKLNKSLTRYVFRAMSAFKLQVLEESLILPESQINKIDLIGKLLLSVTENIISAECLNNIGKLSNNS